MSGETEITLTQKGRLKEHALTTEIRAPTRRGAVFHKGNHLYLWGISPRE